MTQACLGTSHAKRTAFLVLMAVLLRTRPGNAHLTLTMKNETWRAVKSRHQPLVGGLGSTSTWEKHRQCDQAFPSTLFCLTSILDLEITC